MWLYILQGVGSWFQRFLYIGGGLFLLYLAYGAYKAWKNFDPTIPYIETETQQSILKAALINTLNPNPYIFWSLVTGPILVTGWRETPAYGLGFMAGFYAMMILGFSLVIIVFGSARQLGSRVNRALLGISAIALFCFGLVQLWLGLVR
jgi:threonine/homoserine/homoserine lactone efflux protein